ncbi:MAG: substrate-binding domain-containing protein [Anaerolineae bacterium]
MSATEEEIHLYQAIAEAIRRQIASGALGQGDRLPAIRAMAGQWECTPGTVARAYRELHREGLVVGHRGQGTRVAPAPMVRKGPALGWAELVHRAERYLFEALAHGHAHEEAETALSVAVMRWREIEVQPPRPLTKHGRTSSMRISASHDLALDRLVQLLSRSMPNERLVLSFPGSLGALMALAQGEADVAGIHLWDEATDRYNDPFVTRVLPGTRAALLTMSHRLLGLIVSSGNREEVGGLDDLRRKGMRLANRQPGSGTRVWLDAQLQRLRLSTEDIDGYEREEATHLAVAEAVASGEATVGLGIRAAAAAYGLEFVPLTRERYDLVIPEALWEHGAILGLRKLLRSKRGRKAIEQLGGYDTSETGRVRWLGTA